MRYILIIVSYAATIEAAYRQAARPAIEAFQRVRLSAPTEKMSSLSAARISQNPMFGRIPSRSPLLYATQKSPVLPQSVLNMPSTISLRVPAARSFYNETSMIMRDMFDDVLYSTQSKNNVEKNINDFKKGLDLLREDIKAYKPIVFTMNFDLTQQTNEERIERYMSRYLIKRADLEEKIKQIEASFWGRFGRKQHIQKARDVLLEADKAIAADMQMLRNALLERLRADDEKNRLEDERRKKEAAEEEARYKKEWAERDRQWKEWMKSSRHESYSDDSLTKDIMLMTPQEALSYVRDNNSPWKIFGVAVGADKKTMLDRYRQLLGKYHPDIAVNTGIDRNIATEIAAALNAARDKLR